MIVSLADFWSLEDLPQARTPPKPVRRSGPVLIGDILTSRGGQPEFLLLWREDRDAVNGD